MQTLAWDRPAFVMSLDVELAWGIHDLLDPSSIPFERVPQLVDRVLDVLDRYRAPATWAFVGHLLLDGCERGEDGRAHPDMPRPNHRWSDGDWYGRDPCSDETRAPSWYCPTMARQIAERPAAHDLGCHGFSHAIIGDPGCDRATAAAEFEAARKAVASVVPDPVSFVYPRNSVGHVDALRQAGFGIFRGRDASWVERCPGPVRKPLRLVDACLPIAPPAVFPSIDDAGMVRLAGSMLLMRAEGFRARIPVAARIRKGMLGLDNALARRGIFHLWFHPWNLLENPDMPLEALEAIVARAAKLRDEGSLEILTMADVWRSVSDES